MIFVLVIVLVIMFLATKRITSEKMGNQMTSTRKPSTPYSRPEPAIRYSIVETPPGILRDGSPRPKNRRHISFDSIVTEKKYDVKTGAVSDTKLVKLES